MRAFLRWLPRTPLRRGLLALALACLSGCAGLAGTGAEGRVRESAVAPPDPRLGPPSHMEESVTRWRDKYGREREQRVPVRVADPAPNDQPGVPSRDAWVVVMWRYNGTFSDGCVHGVVVRTDAAGVFRASWWIDPLNFGPQFYPWRRYQRLLVYKPGFALADTGSGADLRILAADQQPYILLHPATGGFAGRLADVTSLLDGTLLNCSDASLISPPSPQMAPVLLAMLDEARLLAQGDADKRKQVEYLQYRVVLATGRLKPPSSQPVQPEPVVGNVEVLAPAAPAVVRPPALH